MHNRCGRQVGEVREHRLIVESELRDPPDLRRLSRALIALVTEANNVEESQ